MVEQQRSTIDREQRRQLVFKAQEIIAQDVPIAFFTYPKMPFVFNSKVWDSNTMVDAAGLGLKNFWTFVQATPAGTVRDMILNTPENVAALNPLYLSGMADSWATELIWDRLMRVGPDGLPKPWAAEHVTWKDPTTVEVKLRSGMKWHDGKPVTVDDVVFSFEAAGSDEVPMFKPFVRTITKVEAVDTSTVRFTLKQPYAAFET
ncbi:MAG: twin-arginine translocation pathway signal protein, partial [Clostridia bacterium]|nr:twin-arginine translocation pathway signal protein [Clostridia bacterium]